MNIGTINLFIILKYKDVINHKKYLLQIFFRYMLFESFIFDHL